MSFSFPSGRTIRLLRDQVLILPICPAERYEQKTGSLFTPNKPQRDKGEILWEGEVLATGPGDRLAEVGMLGGTPTGLHRFLEPDGSCQPTDCKPGDRVLYYRRTSAFSAGNVTIEGTEYAIVFEEQHIAAILPPVRYRHCDAAAEEVAA